LLYIISLVKTPGRNYNLFPMQSEYTVMKNSIILLVCAAVSAFAQFNQANVPSSVRLKNRNATFTDATAYNVFVQANNPVGIFEIEDALLNFNIGHRLFNRKNRANEDSTQRMNEFIMPELLVGSPGKMYLDINYSLCPTTVNIEDELATMPFNKFGLFLVGQTEDGRFQFGIKGQGYYGKERSDVYDSSRVHLGVDEVGVCLGSQLHETVRISAYAHAAGFYDSLFTEDKFTVNGELIQWPQERFAYLKLPQIDFTVDVGTNDLPYLSNFCFSYARNHFVYTLKANGVAQPNSHFHQVAGFNGEQWADADPIVTDSIGWHWQNLWRIKFPAPLQLHPALQFGYFHNRSKRMEPGADNHPINYSGEKDGYTWETKSFQFGLGSALVVNEFARVWLEYSRANLALDITGDLLTAEEPDKRGYNRFGWGVRTDFNNIPPLHMPQSIELFFDLSFLVIQENALYPTYKSEPFRFMYAVDIQTQLHRYQPWEEMKKELKTVNVGMCLGASFLEKIFGVQVYLGIINAEYTKGSEEKYKGVEFGLDLGYNMFSAKK